MGEHVAALLMEEQSRIKLLRIAVPDTFVEHGDVDTLYRVLGMDADTVTNRICEGL
jgi:1-deoxy-D-xylulose-5-phosphate synthase